MIRPTLRTAFLFSSSIPVALLLIILRPATWGASFYLPFIVSLFFLADAMRGMSAKKIKIEIKKPENLYVGKEGIVFVDLFCQADGRELLFEAQLETDRDRSRPVDERGYMREGHVLLRLPFKAEKRGQLVIRAVWLRWKGPWGLCERVLRHEVEQPVGVLPDIKGMRDAGLRFFSNSVQHGERAQRIKGDGTEFESLCEFSAGMDSRLIDWKRSAHHRRLLSKEFRQERNCQLVLALDTGRLMAEEIDGLSKLDHAIHSALLLCWVALASGDFVGGASFDRAFHSFLPPGRGLPFHMQFQRFASKLDYHTEETNFVLGLSQLYGRLPRRSLIVLFTDFVDQISAELLLDAVQLLSRRHLVVFVTFSDPLLAGKAQAFPEDVFSVAQSVVAGDLLRDRAVVLERMARMGVHCLDVPAKGLSPELLNRYLMIKQRGLL